MRSADLGKTVVVRFAAEDERANAGYHIEGSYPAPDGSGAGWVNIRSRARGLLALFLLTDVGRHDAPTRLLHGSHLAVPQFLAPYGEAGTSSDADFWRPSTLCMTAAHGDGGLRPVDPGSGEVWAGNFAGCAPGERGSWYSETIVANGRIVALTSTGVPGCERSREDRSGHVPGQGPTAFPC